MIQQDSAGRSHQSFRLCPAFFFLLVFFSCILSFNPRAQTPVTITSEETLLTALLQIRTEDRPSATTLLERHFGLLSPRLHEKLLACAADSYYLSGSERALFLSEIALEVATRLEDQQLLGRTHYAIGRTLSGSGNIEAAIQSCLASHKAFTAAGRSRDLIYLLSELSSLALYAEQYAQAKSYAEQSLTLAAELKNSAAPPGDWPDDYGGAGALSVLGSLSQREGRYEDAFTQVRQSLALYRRLQERHGQFAVQITDQLTSLARLHRVTGDHRQAMQVFQQALTLARTLPAADRLGHILNGLGVLALEQEDYAQAAEYLRQGLRAFQSSGHSADAALVLLNLGVAAQRQQRYDEALAYFQQSLRAASVTTDRDTVIAAGEGIAVIERERRNYAAALKILERSLLLAEQLQDQTRIAEVLWRRAEVLLAMGNPAEALPVCEKAFELAQQLRLPRLSSLIATTLGQSYLVQNRPSQAAEFLTQALEQIEVMRQQIAGREEERQLFLAGQMTPYHLLIDLRLDQQRPLDALACVEQARSRVLLDALSRGGAGTAPALTAQEQAESQRLNQTLLSLNQQLREARASATSDPAQVRELEARLAAARTAWTSFQNLVQAAHEESRLPLAPFTPLTTAQLAALIEPQTALLEYVITGQRVSLFVLTRNQNDAAPEVRAYQLAVSPAELTVRTRRLQKLLAERHPAFASLARELYELLLRPAEEQLRGKDTLGLIPDGALWELPFQALRTTKERYLIEDFALFYAPSLTTLHEMMKHPRTASMQEEGSLLALGNPLAGAEMISQLRATRRGERFDPLPEAESEVRAIAQVFGPARSRVLTGAQADELTFKTLAPGFSVLHLATHGVLDNAQPLWSYLLLATPDKASEDGLLEAREIMQLNLQADLVVLSACETARGRIGAGEGVIGLSWAFALAGSRTTLVSQWKVSSASTAELMVSFFQALRPAATKTELTRAQALRQASLKMLRHARWQHPFYWAGFLLVGRN